MVISFCWTNGDAQADNTFKIQYTQTEDSNFLYESLRKNYSFHFLSSWLRQPIRHLEDSLKHIKLDHMFISRHILDVAQFIHMAMLKNIQPHSLHLVSDRSLINKKKLMKISLFIHTTIRQYPIKKHRLYMF